MGYIQVKLRALLLLLLLVVVVLELLAIPPLLPLDALPAIAVPSSGRVVRWC